MHKRYPAPFWALFGNPTRLLGHILAAAALAGILAATVKAAGSSVVISQVYGGGGSGSAGPPYRNDYVELFNPGTAAVSVSGWSVQYGSATGTSSWQVSTLSGTIGAGQYFLVQENAGTTNGAVLPTPDAVGTISMSATNGKVALVSSTTALTGANPTGASIVDKVGYGTANGYETAAAPTLTNTTALFRGDGGCTDTNDNSKDFTAGTPAPRNSASPTHSCGGATADSLVFSTQPGAATAGAAFPSQPVITAQLAGGVTDTAFTGTVTLAIKPGSGSPSGSLAGTATLSAVAGVATFTGLSIAKASTGYVLTASGTGANSVDSAAFDVTPASPSMLAFTVQPSGVAAAAPIAPAPAVSAQDAFGNTTPSFVGAVSVALNGGTAGATLSGTATRNAASGIATFPDLSIDKAGTAYTLTASSPGLASATSSTFDVGSGQPVSMSFTIQPGGGTAGTPFTPQPVVTLVDAAGNTASFSGQVTIAIKSGTGATGAVLGGSSSVAAVNGIATYSGLSVDQAGANYVLTATAAGLSADSSPFTITPAQAPVGYSITDLGTLPSAEAGATAYRINNAGQVAGWSGHPFLWANGTMTDLNTSQPASVFVPSPARGVNDSGVVVGTFFPFTAVSGAFDAYYIPHAFKWAGGTFTDLTPTATTSQQAVAINNAGDVAIASSTSFIRKNDGTTVPLIGLTTGTYLSPNDINDSGDVVGDAVTASWYTHAALWHAGVATDLGTLPGDQNSSAKAISFAGTVVGDSYGATSTSTNTNAVVWHGANIATLSPRTTGESDVALGLNAYGEIVGYAGSDTANGNAAGALLWENGSVRDLQTLIPANSGWQLSAARSVNDRGQVVGYGWHNNTPRAFLLTPNAVFGDANGDGLVTPVDAILVAAMAAGTAPASNLMYLDVAPSPSAASRGFGNGQIDLMDAVRILRRAASLEVVWP